MPLLLDTGPLYALADSSDAWHAPVRDFLAASEDLLLVPVTVLPEVAYLLRSRLGVEVERRFVSSLAQHELAIEGLATPDLDRCRVLLDRYPDLGFVDATVVAIAERFAPPRDRDDRPPPLRAGAPGPSSRVRAAALTHAAPRLG